MKKKGYVYIISNKPYGTLYVGVTSNLIKRVRQHKSKILEGFTKKYLLDKLVYYEERGSIKDAIVREKQLKGGDRESKIALIKTMNADRKDLYEDIIE